MSKKILSLALAVIMLFSVCSVAVSAADLSAGKVGIRIDTNLAVGMEAGKDVWVKVYFDVPTVEGYLHGLSPVCIAYTDALELDTAFPNNTSKSFDARVWGSSYDFYLKEDSLVNSSTNNIRGLTNTFTANDKTRGWDNAVIVGQQINTDNGHLSSAGYPIDPDCEVFTLKFKTTRKVESTDNVGVPEASAGKQTSIKWNENNSNKPYNAADIILTEAVVYAKAPSYDVYNLGGKNGEDAVKKANDDGTYKIGTFFAFKAATIAPGFIEGNPDVNLNGKSENIEAITATITATKADGTTSTITADPIKYVYDVSAAKDKSELGFVVVINGIPNDDTSITSYTITPVMQTNDGKTYTCQTLTVNVADLA